ncbi:MAG: hypothetical protein WA399_16640 [Acidobacteriaceae bacterium]
MFTMGSVAVVSLVFVPVACFPQSRTERAAAPVTQVQVRGFLNDISGLPVEYRADIAFRVLEGWSSLIPWNTERKLLEGIFEDAPQAKYPSAEMTADGRYTTVAHQQELDLHWSPLDTLDLQARVVSLMRRRAPLESWSLLQEIALPERRASCKDSLTDTFTPYYQVTASSLASFKSRFLPNGQTKSNWLVDQADRLRAPAQVKDFVDMLGGVDMSANDFSPVLGELLMQLTAIQGSDREMYAAEQGDKAALTASIGRLIGRERSLGIDPGPTLRAYREFLIANLHGLACADKTLDRGSEAAAFNGLDPQTIGIAPKPVAPLTAKSIAPAGTGDSASFENVSMDATTGAAHRIIMVFSANQKAVHASDDPNDYLQPSPEDVQDLLQHFLNEPEADGQSPLAQFENRLATLEFLATVLPPGDSFADAIDAELNYLNLNPIEEISPESWLRPLKTLLQISRPIDPQRSLEVRQAALKTGGAILLPNPQALMIRETMRRYQSDRIIAAYLSFESTFHPPYVTLRESLNYPPL